MRKLLVLFMVLLGVIGGAIAQDVDCEPDLTTVETFIDDAMKALDDGDLETALELIQAARSNLESIEAQCTEVMTYYVTSNTRVNLRSCGATSCGIVATANPGEALRIVSDSGDWYEVVFDDGSTGYIAAFLVSDIEPVIQTQPIQPVAQPTNAPVQATAVPQQVQPTNVSVQPVVQPTQPPPPTQPPAPAFTCDCSKTCGAMTCEEAYFQLQQCGCGRRDSDKDGVPCESICPGG